MITFSHGSLTPWGESAFNALSVESSLLGAPSRPVPICAISGRDFYSAVKKQHGF